MTAEEIVKGLTPELLFRAVMIANGDNDPGNAAKGMLENTRPSEREYITGLSLTVRTLLQKGTQA